MAKKLTEKEIIEIWVKLNQNKENKLSYKSLAQEYGVSESTIRRIDKLEYQKYKDIINKWQNENKKRELTTTESKLNTENTKNTKNTENTKIIETEFKEITKDQFAGVLFSVLTKYIQPEIAKYLIDNYIISEKVSHLIDGLIVKINETKSIDFYKESLITMTTLLLQKVLQPEYLVKVFEEKENNENKENRPTIKQKGIEKTKN